MSESGCVRLRAGNAICDLNVLSMRSDQMRALDLSIQICFPVDLRVFEPLVATCALLACRRACHTDIYRERKQDKYRGSLQAFAE